MTETAHYLAKTHHRRTVTGYESFFPRPLVVNGIKPEATISAKARHQVTQFHHHLVNAFKGFNLSYQPGFAI